MNRNTRLILAYASIRRHYPAEMRKALADEIRLYRRSSCGAAIAARLYGANVLSPEPERVVSPPLLSNWTSTDLGPLKPAFAAIVANDGRSPLLIDDCLVLTQRDPATWTITVARPVEIRESADFESDAIEAKKTTSPFAP